MVDLGINGYGAYHANNATVHRHDPSAGGAAVQSGTDPLRSAAVSGGPDGSGGRYAESL